MAYKKIISILSGLLLSCDIWALTPFSANYTADFKMPFNGSAVRELKQNGDTWHFKFEASLMMVSISEKSSFKSKQNQLVSSNYSYVRSGMGKKGNKNISQTFIFGEKVNIKQGDNSFSLNITPQVLDKNTYQLALQQDLAAGKNEFSYEVLDVDKVETYNFKVVGTEEIKTKAGKFNAVKVARIREENSKRQTILWFAPNLDFLLIKLEQIEKDGKSYQIVLKNGELDGRKIKGN